MAAFLLLLLFISFKQFFVYNQNSFSSLSSNRVNTNENIDDKRDNVII